MRRNPGLRPGGCFIYDGEAVGFVPSLYIRVAGGTNHNRAAARLRPYGPGLAVSGGTYDAPGMRFCPREPCVS